jgi:hypothetical protein
VKSLGGYCGLRRVLSKGVEIVGVGGTVVEGIAAVDGAAVAASDVDEEREGDVK